MPVGVNAYPAALNTHTTLIEQHDGAITTLSTTVTAGDTTFTVPSTSTLSATGVVVIEGENVGYTGKTATTLTGLTRGLFQTLGGSAPAPHTAGAAIEQLVIAGTHRVQNEAIIALEAKLGFGADVAALNEFLVGTGAGSSGWRALISGDVTGALGFTPSSIAGAAFTGAVSVTTGAAPVATSGVFRLPNDQAITARNAANLANVNLIWLDALDQLQLYGGAAHITAAGFLSAANLWADAVVESGGSVQAASFVDAGVNPAASGTFRMPNDQWLRARNAGNTADIDLIKAAAGGSVIVGPASGISIASNGALTLALDLPVSEGGTGASDAATARTNLGAQAADAELTAIAGLTSAADRLPYFTGAGTAALATFTAAGRALVDDADATAQRATLGLIIGTNVQAADSELTALAALVSAADRLPYFTGSGTAALATFTAAGRALLDDANAAAQLVTLGITATAAELNKLDGALPTTAELNFVDGVTSAIQTQLNAKPDDMTDLQHDHSAAGAQGGVVSAVVNQSKTIASDAITLDAISPAVSTIECVVDTEAATAFDSLGTINITGTVANGTRLILRQATSARDIHVNATGNIVLGWWLDASAGANTNIELDVSTTDRIVLDRVTGGWIMTGTSVVTGT